MAFSSSAAVLTVCAGGPVFFLIHFRMSSLRVSHSQRHAPAWKAASQCRQLAKCTSVRAAVAEDRQQVVHTQWARSTTHSPAQCILDTWQK